MREAKYRAWDKINKRMFTPISIHHFNYLDCIDGATGQSSGDVFSLKRKDVVLMQYTDCKDECKKEVCEGDIIEKDKTRFIIKFYKGRFFAKLINGKESEGLWDFGLNSDSFKIKGNVYENPKLLKKIKKCEHKKYKVLDKGSCIDGPHQEDFWEKRECKKCGEIYTADYL